MAATAMCILQNAGARVCFILCMRNKINGDVFCAYTCYMCIRTFKSVRVRARAVM